MADPAYDFTSHAYTVWRPSHYSGESVLGVTATQIEGTGLGTAERKRVLSEWIEFFRSAPTNIRELQLVSRVPQELLDSLAGQPQLEALLVKWGPYRDVTALDAMTHLTKLRLGGATGLESLTPLLGLPRLSSLAVVEAHRVVDAGNALGQLTGLTALNFGNDHPGSDKSVVIEDLTWVEPLQRLTFLALPGTRLANPDLSPLLGLPSLETLRLPLRRAYRAQVFEFAGRSPAFAQVAREYEAYESWRAKG
jgi:hypothetical protein